MNVIGIEAQMPDDYISRFVESKLCSDKQISLRFVAESNWGIKQGSSAVPLEFQVHITNQTEAALVFPVFDTFGLRMFTGDGQKIMPRGGRDHTLVTRSVLLQPGGTYALCRNAEIRWNAKTNSRELVYWDGTGTQMVFGPLAPGNYKLGFWFSARESTGKKSRDGASWVHGALFTEEVLIEVLNPD